MLYQMWINGMSPFSEQTLERQTEAERDAEMKALIAAHTESGARPLILCQSGWADEQHPIWGVTAFPSLESRMKQHDMMVDYGRYQKHEPSFTLLGTAVDEPQADRIKAGMIYSLWVARYEPYALAAYNALSKDDQEDLFQKVQNTFNRLGGCMILRCSTYWANDAYRGFGVEAFPSLEAFQQYKAELEKLDWPLYVPATCILGTLNPQQESLKTIFG